MKNALITLAATLVSFQAFASAPTTGVYTCTLQGTKKQSTLIVYTDGQTSAITWMPASGLKTTKANAKGRNLNSGETEFVLFGFQDQNDVLDLPKGALQMPKTMTVTTYHDNDDVFEDTQTFDCVRY